MAEITLADPSLKEYELPPRVMPLKEIYFKAVPEICIERAKLITRFMLENNLFNQERISVLDKALSYRYVLENRKAVAAHTRSYRRQTDGKEIDEFDFKDGSLFAGSTTSKFKGVPLYPEFLALQLWPELWTITKRERNPYHISDDDVRYLNIHIFPHWMHNTIHEIARTRCFEENLSRLGLRKSAPEMKLFEKIRYFLASKTNCISHTVPGFSKALTRGLQGIIDEAIERESLSDSDSSRNFYRAVTEAMEGLIRYSHRLADEADKLAVAEENLTRRSELEDISSIHRHVPQYPARTFREGLTTVWICWIAVHLENPNVGLSLGRLDQLLYPLYRRDIDEGTLSVEDAIELLCCLWLKIGDHVPAMPSDGEQLFGGTGSNQAVTIGGVDMQGEDAVNDLTYVMLRATELMMLRDPNLNARYYSGVNSKPYLRRICEANMNTGATPAIHNDKAVIHALTGKRDTLEQARDYAVIGCVEPGSNGRSYAHSGALLLNLAAVLELTLFNGRDRYGMHNELISEETGNPANFQTFEEFKTAFRKQTSWMIKQATTLNNILGKVHQDFYPTPILSALFEGPMETGKDLIEGGAPINSSGAAIIGLGDVADSLSAIQKVVFEERTFSFAELLDALNKNFKGYEILQKGLTNPEKTPKFGNEDPAAEANVYWLVEMLNDIFGETQNYRGGNYRVGYWSMTNHAGFGAITKALPNGRKQWENLTSGITPVSGATPYLTKALNSVASLPARCMANGVALNLKYTPEMRNQMLDDFAATVEGYFDDMDQTRDGGMEIQFNIADRNTFIRAMTHPEEYPELLVRVSGYTAYFKDLNPQMQQEIINRTEYNLSDGRAISHEPIPLPKED